MGIEDPTANAATPNPLAPESQAPGRPATPTWADESTIALPLTELFPDDVEE
ncbi:MAG: hypothetical protein JWP76_4138 [Dactylosporangium sp.]|jgi:hypothetical protein|nr:hypothetical protein [Dactylosporangium sp.]